MQYSRPTTVQSQETVTAHVLIKQLPGYCRAFALQCCVTVALALHVCGVLRWIRVLLSNRRLLYPANRTHKPNAGPMVAHRLRHRPNIGPILGRCDVKPTKRTKHKTCIVYNICTKSAQRLRRWSNIVQMLYKCVVFAGLNEHLAGGAWGDGMRNWPLFAAEFRAAPCLTRRNGSRYLIGPPVDQRPPPLD